MFEHMDVFQYEIASSFNMMVFVIFFFSFFISKQSCLIKKKGQLRGAGSHKMQAPGVRSVV